MHAGDVVAFAISFAVIIWKFTILGRVQMAVQIHTTMQSHFALIVMQRFGNMIPNIQTYREYFFHSFIAVFGAF